jgi:hypothetical protein
MTAEQPSLFEPPPPEHLRNMPLEERWWFFKASNGPLLRHIEERALRMVDDGYRRISVKLLFELARGEAKRDPGATWNLNNDYTAPCARWLIARHPHLSEFIRIRPSKVDA